MFFCTPQRQEIAFRRRRSTEKRRFVVVGRWKAVWLSGRVAGLRYVTWMSRAAEIGQYETFNIGKTVPFGRPLPSSLRSS
ncbi:hypothetical protein CS8_075470 [Cupriavidus sp. 8B]